ncbi:MAG: hydantoinase/oxoprolinase family protein, partial [Candidatus Rokuibacteriota bacterium]
AGSTVAELEAAWMELERQARAWLEGEQVPGERQRFERAADLRYEHQSFELTCPLGEGPLTAARLEALLATFHAEHRRLYSYDLPKAPVELVNLRLTAVGALPHRETRRPASGAGHLADARIGHRPVYFRGAGFVSTPCYARDGLAPGLVFDGPALIEQDDATPLVAPGFRARVDEARNLLLERSHD